MNTIQYFQQTATANKKLSKKAQLSLYRVATNPDLPERRRNKAKRDLLNSTYGLCLGFCKERKTDHMLNLEEMLHVCIEAQERAFKLFDPDKGSAFSTYLRLWLSCLVISSLKQMRVIKLPSHVSLRDSVLRVSMTGQERDFEFSDADILVDYQVGDDNTPVARSFVKRTIKKPIKQACLF